VSVSPRGLGARDVELSVVWLRGEHDIATESKLARTLAWAVALDDADVVVDLSGVRFMAAATVGAIIDARNALLLRSRSLTLRSPSTRARRVIERCGLAGLVDPPTVATTLERGAPSALGSWVAVPAADRVDLGVEVSSARIVGPQDQRYPGRTAAREGVSSAAADAQAMSSRLELPVAREP
jgi:anti-anti-sigma factor